MPFYGKVSKTLAKVHIPLYTVQCLGDNHILIAGGGGSSNTGISNIIEIYELINNGTDAKSVAHYETDDTAVMNCTVYNASKHLILFAGMEGRCQLYKIKYDACDTACINQKISEEKNLKQRIHNESVRDQDSKVRDKLISNLSFTIQPLESFQTDFSKEPFQKSVRFSNIGKVIVTAGADGCLRVWKYPKLNMLYEIKAHSDEVDDIDICPLGRKIASVSRDGNGKIWDIKNGQLISNLNYTLPLKYLTKYIFRSCRFGVTKENKNLSLYTTLNPAVRVKTSSPSFLCKWNTEDYTMQQIVNLGTDMPSVMTISDNGFFLGLGTQGGNVKMYNAFNLQQLHNINNAHKIFVTGLQFLDLSNELHQSFNKLSLISISVDNQINVHHIFNRRRLEFTIPGLIFLVIIFLCLYMFWTEFQQVL